MNLNRTEALRYRRIIEKASESLPDEQALDAPGLFEHWHPDQPYEAGKRLYYKGKLYRTFISHTSQADWAPDVSPSLFAEVLIPDPDIVPEWTQPDSTNPYMKGDKVRHNEQTWVSDIDNNVWEPGVYGWSRIED